MRRLQQTHLVIAALLALHAADHLRQGTARLSTQVTMFGTILIVIGLITLPITLTRRKAAPAIAIIVGFGTAAAVSASHLLPRWSSYSDPYPPIHPDAISWLSLIALIVSGLALAAAGAALLSKSRRTV